MYKLLNKPKYGVYKSLTIDQNYTPPVLGKVIIRLPEINTVSVAEVGENMYSKFDKFMTSEYTVKMLSDAKGINGLTKEPFVLNKWHDNEAYVWPKTNGIIICYPNRINDICLMDINNIGMFTHSTIKHFDLIEPLKEPVPYKVEQKFLLNEQSFKYQVLYQGKIDNKIKISFREFINNMARLAFTQNIEYELKEDSPTTIGFKGLRIEILEATNFNLKYIVKKDFDN